MTRDDALLLIIELRHFVRDQRIASAVGSTVREKTESLADRLFALEAYILATGPRGSASRDALGAPIVRGPSDLGSDDRDGRQGRAARAALDTLPTAYRPVPDDGHINPTL